MKWILKRLSTMTFLELVYRLQQLFQTTLEKCGVGLACPGKPSGSPASNLDLPDAQSFAAKPYLLAADEILAGRFDIFSMKSVELGFPPNWNRDPQSAIEAPLVFGKTLNYRNEKIVGNIKYLWEPNRHLELVTLAQAWYLSGDDKYAEGCRNLLISWFDQCPYPLGVNWTSSLEHAVRLVNWSYAWHLLGGEQSPLFVGSDGQAFRTCWLESIYQHCHFISGHFSKYSSANNHLLGEYMGLFVGSTTWPLWKASSGWQLLAQHGFETEALKQNAPDGVNREQTTWYHHEVADMMLICGLIGKANAVNFSPKYWQRLEAMLDFIAAIMAVGGHVPMIGDADDAVMVRFSREEDFNPYMSLLATGAALFRRGDFKAKAGRFDDKSRWLLGDDGAHRFAEVTALDDAGPNRRAFADGGYYVLGDAWNSTREVRMLADAGSLGYLSIAAHGHADALAFTLAIGGLEMLVDPGTYAYHTQTQWRDYFRGTSAHNTVRIDGLDQSVIGGNFMWLKHAKAKLHGWSTDDGCDRWVASHDGYLRLPDPVLHYREIVFDKGLRTIVVQDRLECNGKHSVEIHWHCHEDAHVSITGTAEVTVTRGANSIILSMANQGFQLNLVRGEENPPLGWVSRRFDTKVPATTVVCFGEMIGSSILETSVRIVDNRTMEPVDI